MKLYFSRGACSLAVRIIINELGKNCEFEAVNLKSKQTDEGQDYLKINPKGSVPVLELDNGQRLTENCVILQFLADSSQARHLLPGTGDFNRYRVLEWLNFITTELHKSFGAIFNPKIPQEMKDKVFIPIIKTKLGFVDKQLKHRFLMGNDFTLPDAYLFVILFWCANFKINIQEFDHLPNYFKNLQEKDCIAKSLKQEGLEIA
ncbi:glutathione transferase GstA [Legionella jordanis]|uniref:Glutathione S-transferase n=1 Tax=Legionella jordanis TaxID=456 RepID=A0A0W0V968_9GAMM|nr:glutathione transferase GstA [Legionella jordanis]KTD16413.1 glutathione S-transferase [Legionella jordanis]RMX04385.1 glutathione transferase GstA [Legionella jordanis]RMX15576.1 glutathione transferase GstA [Legionella jordanis]VEH12126.1 glutathione S-transferase [Legionella jordanis]HAT8714976.1 glutathione transferase GstA [Legionella jordanis]